MPAVFFCKKRKFKFSVLVHMYSLRSVFLSVLTLALFLTGPVRIEAAEQEKALKKPQYQSFSIQYKDSVKLYQYAARSRDWKLRMGYRESENKTMNLGLQNKYLSIGTVQPYGAYKIFRDRSSYYAWSSDIFQKFQWGLESAGSAPYWGARLGVDPLQVWTLYHEGETRYGAALGYDFTLYEPRLLYQYSARNNSSSLDDTWLVRKPTASSLHQLGLSQKLKWYNSFFTKAVLLGSLTNTEQLSISGYGQLQFLHENIDIKFSYSQSEQKYIHEEWDYTKYLWSVSMESTVYYQLQYKKYYKNRSYLRLRSTVREYHPLDTDYSNEVFLYQKYEFRWRHGFADRKKVPALQFELGYVWNLHDGYYHADFAFTTAWKQVELELHSGLRMLYNAKTGNGFSNIETLEFSLKPRLEYTFLQYRLTLISYLKFFSETKLDGEKKEFFEFLQSIVEEVELGAGFRFRIGDITLDATYKSAWYPSDADKTVKLILDIGMRYTIR